VRRQDGGRRETYKVLPARRKVIKRGSFMVSD
jgi:hypothetical protein